MSADRQQPDGSGGQPREPEMNDDQRALTSHHAAVRANLGADPGDIGHAARTLRHAIGVAEDAFLDVPAEVRAAADHLAQWDAKVHRQLAAERAEREATGITPLAQQAAIERAWDRRRAADRPRPAAEREGRDER